MIFIKHASLIALLFAGTILSGNQLFAQVGKSEHNYLAVKTGQWSVTMTFRPSAEAPPQIIDSMAAERIMVGDYCLHEVMHPVVGAKMPPFQRLSDLAYNLNEQRWDYMSVDSRVTAGIMYFTYQGSTKDTITSFITSFPNPGMGAGQKGRGQALYARNVVININDDHDMVRQYWRSIDKTEWLAVQYDYIRSH
jgi:Protein of unknown function (DUF1579)